MDFPPRYSLLNVHNESDIDKEDASRLEAATHSEAMEMTGEPSGRATEMHPPAEVNTVTVQPPVAKKEINWQREFLLWLLLALSLGLFLYIKLLSVSIKNGVETLL